MSTFTQSQLAANVKDVHVGVQVVSSMTPGAETSATGTASSVFLLCRVPNGATIVDWHLYCTTGGDQQVVQIGTSASPSGIAAAFSLTQSYSISTSGLVLIAGATNNNDYRAPQGDRLPVRISLSDDVQPAEVWIQAEVAVAISSTALFMFSLFYTMDGLTGRRTIR